MKKLLTLGLVAAFVVLAQKPVKKVNADELKTLLDEKKNIFFLDVREPKELDEVGTIKGYTNIPVGQLESRLSEVPKDRPIVTACAHGVRATRAAEILIKNGYQVLAACGLSEWKEKNYPVVYPKKK